MRVAIVTCEKYPDLTPDDQVLRQELERRGHCVVPWIWSTETPPRHGRDVDALVVRSPWDYYLHFPRFRDVLKSLPSAGAPTLLNSVALIEWNARKRYLSELASAGIPTLPTRVVDAHAGIARLMGALNEMRSWGEVVLKPEISGGALLTRRVRAEDFESSDVRAFCEELLSHGDVLIQPFAPSVLEDGEVSLIYFQGPDRSPRFSHAILKRGRGGDFRVQSDFGGTETPFSPNHAEHAVAEQALHWVSLQSQTTSDRCDFAHWLYARVDLLSWQGNWVVGELEMIEPQLFFRHDSGAAARFADALESWTKIGHDRAP